MGAQAKALAGGSVWAGKDPLVLDLDNDGINLTPVTTGVSPFFDLDDDGFAEQVGWIAGGDAFLVQDLDANGLIETADEMFGSTTQTGFEELADLDSNADGLITSLDDDFGTLKLWKDANGDGITDAGELVDLAAENITAISLTTTEDGSESAGNVIERTATFTRGDGSTGTAADVTLALDNYDSVWLGSDSIDPAVADRSDLKGHGTLVDLRLAMSLELAASGDGTSALRDALDGFESALTALDPADRVDLDLLRNEVRSVLQAWAEAPPAGGTVPNPDVAILIDRDGGATTVSDYAIKTVDGNGTYYVLASGDPVTIGGATISFPSFQDVLDQDVAAGSSAEWEVLQGADISFLERYMGEEIPVEALEGGTADPGALAALSGMLEILAGRMDALAVSLAAQGPLSAYFSELDYDLDADLFLATGNRELTPFFTEIFNAAPADTGGAENWLDQWQPIVNTVLDNFQRAESHQKITHSYIFANIVAAHENTGINVPIESVAAVFGMPGTLLHTAGDAVGDTVSSQDEVGIFYIDGSQASGGGGLRYEGGLGDDSYVVGARFDGAVIDDEEQSGSPQVADILRFAQHTPEDLEFSRDGRDLVVTNPLNGDVLTIEAHFTGFKPNLVGGANLNPDRGVSEIVFVDGTVWNRAEIAEAVARPENGDQVITGTDDLDVLDGGAGNDTLSGGDEGDVYVFDAGYGQDRIDDQAEFVLQDAPDFVRFGAGLSGDDLVLSRDGNGDDLTMSFDGIADSLVIEGQFDALYTDVLGVQWLDRIEFMTFRDGDFLTWEGIMQRMVREAASDGDDVIWGFAYEDTIDGGAGDDLLGGGNENDTYLFGEGDGRDVIRESIDTSYSILSGQHDVVVFDTGIAAEDLTLIRHGGSDDVTIALADGSSLTIDGQFDAIATGILGIQWLDRIEEFRFTDTDGTVTSTDAAWLIESLLLQASTAGDDVIHGFDTADTIDGGAGNDLLIGGNAGDTYRYTVGEGDDTIADGALNNPLFGLEDVIEVSGAAAADVTVARNANAGDLVIGFGAAGSGSLTLSGQLDANSIGFQSELIERIDFVDHPGQSLSELDLRDLYLQQAVSAGDDTVIGFFSDDTLAGGAGDDSLAGGNGSDVYLYELGDGDDTIADLVTNVGFGDADRIEFGADIDLEHVRFLRPGGGDDLQIEITDTLQGGTATLTVAGQFNTLGLQGIEEVRFDDNTILSRADIRGLLDQATAGNDRIIGFVSDDRLDGGAGDDFLQGGVGNDTYAFSGVFGRDTIADEGDGLNRDDVLDLSAFDLADATFRRASAEVGGSFDDLVIDIENGGRITVVDGLNETSLSAIHSNRIETVVFADGTLTFDAVLQKVVDNGNDAGNGLVLGFKTADVIAGGTGNDWLFGGEGDDTFIFNAGDGRDAIVDGSGNDLLQINGVDPANVIVTRPAQYSGGAGHNDLLLLLGNGDEILIRDALTVGNARVESIVFDDSLNTVWTAQDLVDFYFDDDTLESFLGGTGQDTLDAGSKSDPNADVFLNGEDGSDRYLFTAGDGELYVRDQGFNDDDRIVIDGYTVDQLHLSRLDEKFADLLIRFEGSDDQIVVHNNLNGDADNQIEHIEILDSGVVWNVGAIRQSLLDGLSTAGSDWIEAFKGDETLQGGLGNDTLYGGDGSDLYIYNAGDGTDEINENGFLDNDVLLLRNIAVADVQVRQRVPDQSDLDLLFAGTDDSITIVNTLNSHSDDQVELIQFDVDGDDVVDATWSMDDVRQTIVDQLSTAGDDSIRAFNAAVGETLAGGLGDDTLEGFGGADTYHFNIDDGSDRIYDQGGQHVDRLVLNGRERGDVFVARTEAGSDDLVLTFAEATDRIVIVDTLDTISDDEIEFIDFETDPSWSTDDILALLATEAPIAVDDGGITGTENTTIAIDARALLANDSDADFAHRIDNPGTYTGLYGTLTLNADGSYSYLVNDAHGDVAALQAGESLEDTFSYTGANGEITDAGLLSITIVAPDDGVRLLDDAGVVDLIQQDSIEGNVLANDSDEADVLTMSSVGVFSGAYGTLSLAADGTYSYRVNAAHADVAALAGGETLADTFSYRLTDESTEDYDNYTATLSITIAQHDTGPLAQDDHALAVRGAGAPITGSVLANDRDGAADQLDMVSVHGASTGDVTLGADGIILFTPAAGFTGVASFRYTVTDGEHRADIGQVLVDVLNNEAPVGNDDADIDLALGADAVTAATRLLLNDTDIDGDTLSISSVLNASGLTAGLTVDGDVALSSDGTFAGIGGFDYVVSDGRGGSDSAHVDVIVGVSDGGDTLSGTENADRYHGLAGDDVLAGDAGADSLFGDDGADSLFGGDGADSLDGGAGDDWIYGGAGADTLAGGDGSDTLSYADSTGGLSLLFGFMRLGAWSGDQIASDIEVLIGGSGNDQLTGQMTFVSIHGGSGSDYLGAMSLAYGGDDNDVLSAAAAGGELYGDDGADSLTGSAAADSLFGGIGDDTFILNDGSDTLTANADVIEGGAGIDMVRFSGTVGVTADIGGTGPGGHTFTGIEILSGTYGDDSLSADSFSRELRGEHGADTLTGGDGFDTLLGGQDQDLLIGGAGNDLLYGGVGGDAGDTLQGGDGNDSLVGESSGSLLEGGAGDDTIQGSAYSVQKGGDGDDSLVAGIDDTLFGGAGADTFVGSAGFDVVSYADAGEAVALHAGTGGTAGEALGDVFDTAIEQIVGSDHDDTLTMDDTSRHLYGGLGNDVLTGGGLHEWLHGDDGDDSISGGAGADVVYGGSENDTLDGGADADTLLGGSGADSLTGADGADDLQGEDGDDSLDGEAGNDVLSGGTGDDAVYGGEGDDTLVGGAGADTFQGGQGVDELSYEAATAAVAMDLVSGGSAGDALGDVVLDAVEKLTGSAYDDTLGAGTAGISINAGDGDDLVTGNIGADHIHGADGHDSIDGQGGDDVVMGGQGNDSLDGQSGGDTLHGDDGDDVVQGGAGLDTLYGGSDDDSLSGGDDDDYIEGGTGNDTLSGDAGADYLLAGDGDDVVDGGAGNDTIRGDEGADSISGGLGDDQVDYLNATAGIALHNRIGTAGWATGDTIDGDVELIIGSSYDDTLVAGDDAEHFFGGAGNDIFSGGIGDDSVDGGDGHDSLTLGGGNDWAYGRDGNDTIDGGAGDDGIWGGDGDDVLSDLSGTAYLDGDAGNDSLTAGAGDDRLFGDEGNDTLSGGGGADTIEAGIGNDSVDAGAGDDLIRYVGGLDTVMGGDGSDTLALFFTADGGVLDLTPAGVVLGTDIERIEGSDHADDIRLDDEARSLFAEAGDDTVIGGAANDTVHGGTGNDSITAGAGDDSIEGSEGDDTIWGGLGHDSLSGGHGDNEVHGEDGDDTLISGHGADTLWGDDGNDFIYAGLGDDLVYGGLGDDLISSSEGSDVLYGGAGADTLKGYDENDSIYGGADNDELDGRDGDDLLDGGGGNDSIEAGLGDDSLVGGDGDDTLKGREGADTLIGGGDADELYGYEGDDLLQGGTGNDSLDGGDDNDSLIGGDGVDTLKGRAGNDTLSGDADGDELYGYEGDDLLQGGDGDDSLDGGDDNDRLVGGDGVDTLRGRLGLDTLEGDAGDDQLYGYEGADSLLGGEGADYLDGGSENDTLIGGAGIDDLRGRTGADDLQGGTGNDSLYGYEDADTLSGGDDNDTLYGGLGADSLSGDAGNDRLNGNEGDDILVGGLGDDLFDFQIGGGHDTVTDFVTGQASGDVIDVTEFAFADFNALLAVSDDQNGTADVVISFNANDKVTLLGVRYNDLEQSDFLLS